MSIRISGVNSAAANKITGEKQWQQRRHKRAGNRLNMENMDIGGGECIEGIHQEPGP